MNQSLNPTIWDPSALFDGDNKPDRFALVILNRALNLPMALYNNLWSKAIYKVAADGGANRLHTLIHPTPSIIMESRHSLYGPYPCLFPHLDLDVIIGDLDSLMPDAQDYWKARGVSFVHDSDENSTDFAKAVNYIRHREKQEPLDIVVLGDLSGRVDQAMSILHHLFALQAGTSYESGKLFLFSDEAITFTLLSGEHVIKRSRPRYGVELGYYVGIIPLKEPSIISTSGLEWDVSNWKTEFGGQMSTSNIVRSGEISVQTTKDVLFTIDLDLENPELDASHIPE